MATANPVLTEYFPLSGGLDQVSPTLSLKPGMVRDGVNYECATTGGYTRIKGYERYDGRPSPSEQPYWVLTGSIAGVSIGQTITGATSGATGVLCYVDTSTTPGVTYIAFTKLVGSFAPAGEQLKVGAVVVGSCVGSEARSAAPSPATDVVYQKAAADVYRADIGPVPGSGQVLGVWMYNDVVYAFRNTADGTAAKMYKATGTGWQLVTTPTLAPGGHYEFVNANFGGTTAMQKMFGCDSVNKAFMFDGTTFTQITTGMTLDTPNHIEVHKNFLWLAFDASLQHSAIGDPTTWSVVVGAGEIALGEKITSLKSYIGNSSYIGSSASNAMLIHTSSKTQILYGSSNADFSLSKHSDVSGGLAGSVQIADQPYYMSELGLTNLQVTQAYGNFIQSSLSQTINPFILQEKSRITTSCIVREKSQYRLFFNDGYALYVTFLNGKVLGMMVQNLGIPIRTVCSLKKADNSEWIFAGSDSGYVYQMEKGPNFDGLPILSYLSLVFAAFKSPRIRKRWRKAVLEVKGSGYLEYAVSKDLSWISPDIAPSRPLVQTAQLQGIPWDTFAWDEFFWDGVNNAPAEVQLDGTGENMGLRVSTQSDCFDSYTVESVIVHYSMRRQLR
jgi:hypothetical protein